MKKSLEIRTWNVYFLIAALLCGLLFVSNLGFLYVPTSLSQFIGIVIVLTFTVYISHNNSKKFENFSFSSYIIFCIMGFLFLINGIIYKTPTYILYAFIFLMQIPCIIIKISQDKMKLFYRYFFYCIYLYAIVSVVLSILFVAPSEVGYFGIFGNQNLLGEFISYSLIGCLFVIESDKKTSRVIISNLLVGALFAISFFSRSRTTLLSIIALIIIYLIYLCCNKKHAFRKVIRLVVSSSCMFIIVFVSITYIAPIFSDTNDTNDINEEHAKVSLVSQIDASYDKFGKGINNEGDFSSGRFEIWQAYMENIELVSGHSGHDIEIPNYYPDRKYYANAHNTFIQIAYQIGIVGVVAFLIQFICICIFCLKKLINCRRGALSIYTLIIWMIIANAFVRMMLSSVFSPYSSFSMILYWIVAVPLYYWNRKDFNQGDKNVIRFK